MKDTISEEDMYVDVTKTELEKEIARIKRENKKQKQDMQDLAKGNKEMIKKFEDYMKKMQKLNVTENY